MAKVPVIEDRPELLEPADDVITPPPAMMRPMEVRAGQSVALAEMLAATRMLPSKERAGVQRQVLADPRAWAKGEWLD